MDQQKKYLGSAIRSVLAGVAIAVLMAAPMTANATVHELTAVACSGVTDRHPPGVSDNTKKNFAVPVLASGVVVLIFDDDGNFVDAVIGDSPAAKFPEGTSVFALLVKASTHPAFAHCPKAADLP